MVERKRTTLAVLGDARQLRSRCLTSLSRAVDGVLRSPAFLVCMRYGLAATTRAHALKTQALLSWLPKHRSPPPPASS